MNELNKLIKVPVVFITDKNYLVPTAVAITSLIENKSKNTFYEIYIIVADLNADLNREFEDKLNSLKNENVTVKTFKVNGDKYKKFQRHGHYISTTVLFKFEIANLLPEYEKILYLDGDILVKTDLAELYRLELGNHYVGAARDIYAEFLCKTHQILSVNQYFNSGVMDLNLKKIREDHLSDKMVKVMEERWSDFIFSDQDVFNDIFKENVLWLEPKYNMIISSLVLENKSIEEVNEFFRTSHKNIEEFVKEASIIHLAGGEKPWSEKYTLMNKDWFEYFNKSPFRDFPEWRNFETQTWETELRNQRNERELALRNKELSDKTLELANKTNELNTIYNSKRWKAISRIADNYVRVKRLGNLAKKSVLMFRDDGVVTLWKKVFSYIKGRYEVNKSKKYFTFSPVPVQTGINVVGYLCAETGLGESVRTLAKSIRTTKIKNSLINYKLHWLEDNDKRFEKEFVKCNPYNINVVVINPDNLDVVMPDLGEKFFSNRYNIGYWAWELPVIPEEWKKYEKCFDEFWVPSEFVKQAIIKKISRPVTVVPHSIEVRSFEKCGRNLFGLDNGKFLFSFIFDYNSLCERKNPVAIVKSFKKAFNGSEDVLLVIKCSNPENLGAHQMQHHLLLKEIGKDERIKIISRRLTRDEIYSLLDVSDAYISLHRSEGFGLTIAEAMFLGKPVICTGYSGNTDFTKENNSFLVRCKKIRLEKNIGPYKKGDEWADPEIDEAAKFMRTIFENKELINEVGNRGREYIHNNFSPKAIGKIIEKRFKQINNIYRKRMPLEDNTLQGWRDLFGEKIKPELKKTGLCSSLCKQSDFGNNEYVYWCTQIKEEPRMHRKQWEFYFICQALYEAGVLKRGMKGLGFGVGREPLPAVFANIGCHIVATDMEESEAVIKGWKDTKQHASNVKVLNDRNICPDQIFKDLVSFRCVDMKAIPEDLVNFDFCWSACCMEHLGSIEKGLEFLKSSLKCLKPGGISVHTTEFNLSSENETIDNVGTVLFRKKDMDAISGELKNGGHIIKEINFDDGHDKLDKYYDVPPYRAEQHLKLAIDKFIATSIGLIIQKGGTA